MQTKNKVNHSLFIVGLMILFFIAAFPLVQAQSAASGDLDTTFGSGGKVVTSITEFADIPTRARIQPDGKIVTVGAAIEFGFGTPVNSFLVRHNADGTFDNSFGINGLVVVDSSFDYLFFNDFIILTDGKFLVTGSRYIQSSGFQVIYRYTANGTLDATFGTNGVITTPVCGNYLSNPRIVLQSDGKFVVACDNSIGNSIREVAVVRYNSNGTLDTTFGRGGITKTSVGNRELGVREILVQTDGKLLVAGGASFGNTNIFVLRYNPNGTLDNSFGANGIVQTNVDNQSIYVGGMALQPDGKIIVNANSFSSMSLIVRYNTNGTLDNTFGANGIVRITEFPGIGYALAIQQNGKILTAGQGNETFAISRYNANGTIDTSFGTNGVVITIMENSNRPSRISLIALQTDGKIVAAGTVENVKGFGSDVGWGRYLGDAVTTAPRTRFDFDGDGKTDLSVFRPAPGEWWINRSLNGSTFALQFGAEADTIAPADFTGDGKTDVAFFRPSTGQWFVLRSEDSSFYAFPFGTSGDVPVPADYDADGKADAAVFRPSTLTWFIQNSTGGTDIIGFGAAGDVPTIADYDGDGKADIAIYRPNAAGGAQWWVRRSSNASVFALQFGTSTDKTVQGDYTGDGKADIAFWRPSTGGWFVLRSEDFSFYSFPFGTNGDTPVPGDHDGDGRNDAAVFRPSNSTWFAQRSTAGTLIQQFGITGDIPLPNAYVR